MALTYTWEVTQIKTADVTNTAGELLKGAVVQTYWKKIGTDANGVTGEFSGATPFDPSTKALKDFIPLSGLTEADVLKWIQAVVVGSYADHVNGKIQEQITAKEVKDTPLPWAPVANTSANTAV